MGSRIGAITFGGISSGLPTDEIIGKLVELSKRPITLLEKQRDDQGERLKLYQDLNSKATALRDALRSLDNMANVIRRRARPEDEELPDPLPSAFEEFRRYQALSSDEDRATASVGASASPGSLVFSIDQLALQHRSLSGPYTSADQVVTATAGTISIQVGSGTATSISIAADATVQDVIDAINAEGIDATAFLVNNGQGSVRIAIVGDKTGSANELTLSNTIGQTYTRTQAGQNARITLDPDSALPIAVESATNSFQNVIQGLTIEAKTTTAAGERVTVSVDTDTTAVREGIQKLVDAYNAIADVIRSQNTIDPTTNRGGPLLGDSALVDLAQALSGSLARQYGNGSVRSTGQIGIELTREGKLEVKDALLSDALESNFEGVADFFAGAGQFADSFREVLDRIVDPTDGTLTSRIEGTNDRIAQLRLSITRAEERLESFESNLVRQFAALERTLSQFQEQSNFLANYLTSLSR